MPSLFPHRAAMLEGDVQSWGFSLPNFVIADYGKTAQLATELASFKVNSFEPWGWSFSYGDFFRGFEHALLRPISNGLPYPMRPLLTSVLYGPKP